MWNGLDYKRVYRSNKLSIYKKIAKSILEQAFEDVLRKGSPVKERERWYKDAKNFFENEDYALFCECAEIDMGDMDRWYESLDTDASCKS